MSGSTAHVERLLSLVKATIAEVHGNGQDAPIAVIGIGPIEPLGSRKATTVHAYRDENRSAQIANANAQPVRCPLLLAASRANRHLVCAGPVFHDARKVNSDREV